MSEGEPFEREWRFYIDDMIKFAGKVLAYTEEVEREQFEEQGITYDAVLRNLELIGEAATRVSEEVREAHPDIPWRTIIATRNRLIHAYLGIDNDIVWSIVRHDVPLLLVALGRLREGLGS